MNVREYLQRINYNGSTKPTRENLDLLCRAHRSSIPFSNLDLFGGPKREFNLEDIFECIVRRKRGGICCELNSLFNWLLNQMGFKSNMVDGRFFFKELNKFGEKFTHMVLLVTLHDIESSSAVRYVVNPTYSEPLPLNIEHSRAQIQSNGVFRVRVDAEDADCYYVERHKKSVLSLTGEVLKRGPDSGFSRATAGVCSKDCADPGSGHWTPAYRFSPHASTMDDFAESYTFQICNPESLLRRELRMCMSNDYMSYTLLFNVLSISVPSDSSTDRIVATAEIRSDHQLAGIAADIFGQARDFEIKYFDQPKMLPNGV